MIHRLKILPVYFEQSKRGNKNFEIRKNDRNYNIGDIIILHEHHEHHDGGYSGEYLEYIITYITDFGCIDGYIVMGVRLIEERNP